MRIGDFLLFTPASIHPPQRSTSSCCEVMRDEFRSDEVMIGAAAPSRPARFAELAERLLAALFAIGKVV